MAWLRNRFIGGRIVKTGVAVFLTALICDWLGLPSLFAIITAIVTIEPTAADSIKKGLIRFPASAIGAAIAMFMTWLLGDIPITYALSTIIIIWLCHQLKLDAGMLVATLTAVAMISGIEDHFLQNVVNRLGTTLIGLTTSTAVNFLLLPPKYGTQIERQLTNTKIQLANLFEKRIHELTLNKTRSKQSEALIETIRFQIERTETLCRYQLQEWHYHRFKRDDIRAIHRQQKHIQKLKQLTYHLTNIIQLPMNETTSWTTQETTDLRLLSHQLAERINGIHHDIPLDRDILQRMQNEIKNDTYDEHLSIKSYLYFELLTMHNLLKTKNKRSNQ